ncbi:hypothetical protein PybrP1_012001 [[Pythium] brassicae (nom. inval.)]|nr:hypothetical protein PybrP1_012001 [[Pythium] brassicae (nom. inval.)]
MLILVLVRAAPAGAAEVSVCGDATFDLPTERGAICAGFGDQPSGTACPRAGDVATADCNGYLPSYDSVASSCVAREDAACELVRGVVWGCVFPSLGCLSSTSTSYDPSALKCATWKDESNRDDVIQRHRRMAQSDLKVDEADVDESWFVQDTENEESDSDEAGAAATSPPNHDTPKAIALSIAGVAAILGVFVAIRQCVKYRRARQDLVKSEASSIVTTPVTTSADYGFAI